MVKPGSGFKTSSILLPLDFHYRFRDRQTWSIDKVWWHSLPGREPMWNRTQGRARVDLCYLTVTPHTHMCLPTSSKERLNTG